MALNYIIETKIKGESNNYSIEISDNHNRVLIDSNSNIFDGEFFGGKFDDGACMRETHIEDEWLLIEFAQGIAKLIRKMKLNKELENKPAKEFNFEYSQD